MNGSLPPSSSTVFLMCFPAIEATLLPAPSLPVSVAAATRSSASIAANGFGADEQTLKHAARRARLLEQLFERERALRHVRRVLEQADVAGGDRRRREPNHLPERKIPRHHGEHDADRLERDEAALAGNIDRLVGEKARARCRHRSDTPRAHFAASSIAAPIGLPISMRHQPAVLELALLEQLGGATQHVDRAARSSHARQVRLARVRRGELALDLALRERGIGLDSFARCRVDRFDGHRLSASDVHYDVNIESPVHATPAPSGASGPNQRRHHGICRSRSKTT